MSYILDALRRAQAERERGQVPNLHAQPGLDVGTRARAAATRPRQRPAGLWALGAAALVALLLVPLFWLTRGDGSPPAATANAAAPGAAVAAPGATAAGLTPAWPAPPPGPPLVVVAARPDAQAAVAALPPALAAKAGTAPAAAVAPSTRPASPALSAPPSAAVPPGLQPLRQAPAAMPAVPAVPQPAAATGSETTPAVPLQPPAAVKPAPSASPAMPPMLTAEQLREWPPLSLGGSVWSETPSARFVILGGQVVREGDSTPEGVQVERITPRAVVVRWRDWRGALPL